MTASPINAGVRSFSSVAHKAAPWLTLLFILLIATAHGTHFANVDTAGVVQAEVDMVQARAQAEPAPYAHWYMQGETIDNASNNTAGITTISYAALTPMRHMLLERMYTARASGTVGPEDLRSLMAQMKPQQFPCARTTQDEVQRHFELSLLTEGSGTQIFSTAFIQWAAREVLRRARPNTLLLRYAPRQMERPMNDLVLASASEEHLDPEGSLIDADMGAYYT